MPRLSDFASVIYYPDIKKEDDGMNLYQKEKARIRIGYHYFIMAACMYFFFMQVQSETSMQISAMNDGMGVGDSVILAPDSPVSFGHSAFWIGIVLEMFYLNRRLFWIRERGRLTFLLRKYDTLPVSRRDLYIAKAKVMLKAYAIYLIAFLIIYYEIILSNYLSNALWLEPIPWILLCFILGFLIILALLGMDWLQDRRTGS